MAKKKQKVPTTNKLVAYIRCGKFDTPLDAASIQSARITAWAKEYDYEVVDTLYEVEIGEVLETSFKKAKELGGNVIVASANRVANCPLDYLALVEGTKSNLISAETIGNCVKFNSEKDEPMASSMGMVLTMELGFREKYLSECSKWVV